MGVRYWVTVRMDGYELTGVINVHDPVWEDGLQQVNVRSSRGEWKLRLVPASAVTVGEEYQP